MISGGNITLKQIKEIRVCVTPFTPTSFVAQPSIP